MRQLFTTRKKRLVGTACAFALAVGTTGVAFAEFTTTGSGTASAAEGSSTALSIVQSGSITGLTPGGAPVPVAYTIDNPQADGDQTLGVVSATITNVTPTPGNVCSSINFTTASAGTAVGEISAGGSYTSTVATEPTVRMVESSSNQDGCEGATVNLTLTGAMGS